MNFGTKRWARACFVWLGLTCVNAWAQPAASVPYTPNWVARHALVSLVDQGGLPMLLSHWPQPHAAVAETLDAWERHLPSGALSPSMAGWLNIVKADLQASQGADFRLEWRGQREALVGFGDSVTPGSALAMRSRSFEHQQGGVSVAGRWGLLVSQSQASLPLLQGEAGHALMPADSALVVARGGWSLQAGMQRQWWGPGWQSSLVNGHNQPGWLGLFLQRTSLQPSQHPWLSWMGPWQLEFSLAQAQDPMVAWAQPQHYVFSGARLTMRPLPGLELGLSRGMQTQGRGRPAGLGRFLATFVGQGVNTWTPDRSDDQSSQVAGFDVRWRCPTTWGGCAVYTQWIGEDAAGKALPLPYKFMTQWGLERSWLDGRYRAFWEYSQTEGNSLPWDDRQTRFPGYLNGVYSQGYTNHSRWIGAAQGAGSRVHTLGWLDAKTQRQLKFHWGVVGTSVGAYAPGLNAPHGPMVALSWQQHVRWMGHGWTPEIGWLRLQQGTDQGKQRRDGFRLGLVVSFP